MSLSEDLLTQFRRELYRFERKYFKNIYQIKSIPDGTGGGIMFSCRFKTPDYKTYILSIIIVLGGEHPHVRASIHELCERRWFSKTVAHKREPLEEGERLCDLINDMAIRRYYMDNKHFPYNLMARAFVNNGLKDFIVDNVNKLEGNK